MSKYSKTSRRAFLSAMGGAVAVAHLPSQWAHSAPGDDLPQNVCLAADLPVLREHRVDALVVGGGFAGVAAAKEFGSTSTLVVEPRTYLGREITATLRPWLVRQESLPDSFFGHDLKKQTPHADGEIPLKPDRLKIGLEDSLEQSSIMQLYGSYPVGVLTEDGRVTGLIVANKSGRQIVHCSRMLDTTETSIVARLAGATFAPLADKTAVFRRTLEFDKVAGPVQRTIAVAKELGVVGDQVIVHRGYRGPKHVLVEAAFELPVRAFDADDMARREIESRNRSLRLAAFLVAHVPAFHTAFLAACSYELHGPATTRMQGPPPAWDVQTPPVIVAGLGPLAAMATPLRGLWCLPDSGDPVAAATQGRALAKAIKEFETTAVDRAQPAPKADPPSAASRALTVKEPFHSEFGRGSDPTPVAPTLVPIVRSVDVLVVGGGTSGATAAATAAREGVKTLLVEMNSGLGGTGTIGAVDSYWFGRRVGFPARVSQRVKQVHESIGYPTTERKWNVEAKMFALLRETQEAGVETLFPAIVVAAIVEDQNRVRGVVVATRYGLQAVLAKVVVDATGDGDVAAFAGAECVIGSAMDHITMWCALAQYTSPGRNRNSFTSSADVTNVDDSLRALLIGRLRGGDCHDHGVYLTPRESRHILAEHVLTLTDQLRQRAWPDVVNIHFSNHDIKGKTCSNWLRAGLIPPNLEVELPYRVLLPKGLENILVAGKAFSTTHDGLPAVRMQADLENLGGVVGLAAAMAVKQGCTPRQIDIAALQQRLVREGVLPPETLTRRLKSRRYSDADLQRIVDSLVADKPLLAYQNMGMTDVHRALIPFVEVCTAGPRVVPILEAALAKAAAERKIVVAQALAMCGSRAGVPVLLAEVESLLAGPKLPGRRADIQHVNLPPDQGAAPEVVYLIYSLGMARDRRSLQVWQRVVDLIDLQPADFAPFKDGRLALFCYIDAVCFGAERLGDPAAIPILEKLHQHRFLHDRAEQQWRINADFIGERLAMLELGIGKALARCGSPLGFEVLIGYTRDIRALLCAQANTNLARIGRDLGHTPTDWQRWLEKNRDAVRPAPLVEDLDAVFDPDILTA